MQKRIRLEYNGQIAEIQQEGAQIASFVTPKGFELIWQADATVWPEHAPVLFPVCGAPKDGQVIIDGQVYPMSKHGFTRRNPVFSIARRGQDFVDLVLSENEDTMKCYPFHFELHVIYTMLQHGYRTTFVVENKDKKPMPFCIGGHPAFNCPMEDNAAFEDYDVIFDQDEDGAVAAFPDGEVLNGSEMLPFFKDHRILPLSHQEIDQRDSLLFTPVNSRSVRLVNRNTGKGMTMEFPKMESLAIWSMNGKFADYICLEPWHGIPGTASESGAFSDKPYVTVLEPGESYVTWFDVTLDL